MDYTLNIQQFSTECIIELRSDPEYASTSKYNRIVEFLRTELSSILTCECDNPGNKPFAQEVENTELGHLFEHILLEYLVQEKLACGELEASFEGRTYWDTNNALSPFMIHVQIPVTD